MEGLGTGTVDDRGGAIVKAGERGYDHDRLDVWMGRGDEGLARALAWGKRTVKGRVSKSLAVNEASVSLELASVPKATVRIARVKTEEDRVWSEPIGANSSKKMIRTLSQKLSDVGYLNS